MHFSVLPIEYALTEIRIPDEISIEHVIEVAIPRHWDAPSYHSEVQRFGGQWAKSLRSVVLSVPSSVVSTERNFVINPMHPEFGGIEFLPARGFKFDLRLK